MDPKKLAPFFIITAIIHLAAVVTLFGPVDAKIKTFASWLPMAILIIQFPLLFIASFFESRLKYDANPDFPLWMQIDSKPVKASFTFAFTYLALIALKTWELKFLPANPFPPKGANWDLMTQARWFGIFTVGMFMINFMAATKLLIPLMRKIMLLLKSAPFGLGAGLAAILGIAAGVGAMFAIQSQEFGSMVQVYKAIKSNVIYMLATTVGVAVLTIIVGWFMKPKET
jgi:hypothetical protein